MTAQPSAAIATAKGMGAALKVISPIARGGFALVLGSLIASALGMVFWALAARLLTPEQLGIGAALIAAITTLSHASQLNLRNLVHRYVPGAGKHAAGLIYRSFAVAAAMAILLGAGFIVLVSAIAPDLAFLTISPWAAAGFVAALLIWTLYALQEAVLTARSLARLVPLQSLAYSLAKIACLVGIVAVLPTGSAVLLAWVAPALLIGAVTHLLMSRQLAATAFSAPSNPITRRQIASFFGWDYVGALATSTSLGVAPLLVVSLSGAAAVAPYYLAWSISYMLYLVSRHVGAAMLADLAANAHRRRAIYAEAIVLTLVPVSCGAVALLLFAPHVMLIFGPGYAETGADILRILALASVPGALVTAYLAICRAEEQVRRIALLQVVALVALLAIGGPLTLAMGPLGMAWGWLSAHGLAALLLIVLTFSRDGPIGALDFAADLASATVRLARQLPLPMRRNYTPASATIEIAGRTWITGNVGPASLSDATTQVLTSEEPTPLTAVLKRASSTAGRQALRQEHTALLRLHADGEISPMLGDLLPGPLHFEERTEETILLMSRLPGRDARTLVTRPDELAPVLTSIVAMMSPLHASRTSVAPASWAADWIDAPLARLAAATGQHRRVAALADGLRRHWTGAPIRLGPAHCDFCPDNLLIERDPATNSMRPSGLVDWGGYRPDAPAGFDTCTMAMTLRAASSDRQLGQVVLDLLRQPVWTDAERTWMGSDGLEPWMTDETALRAMVLLVWLHHIDANLGKSIRYTARSYWGLVNIRLVLEQPWP